MPVGSLGTEGPDPEPCDVLPFDDEGKIALFMHGPAGN